MISIRTYEEIYRDYCAWLVKKTGNLKYDYDALITEGDENTVKAFLYKSILDLLYDPKDGIYYFCKFIIGNLLDVGYPKPFTYNRLLRTWDNLLKDNKKLCILCGRGHGKCRKKNSKIALPNGTVKNLIDLKIGDKIVSINNKTFKEEIDTVEHVDYVGKKISYELTTLSGKKTECAHTHPFLTINGWKPLKNLKPGDYIAVPRKIIQTQYNKTITKEDAWLLGWFISEGRQVSINRWVITQKNVSVLYKIQKYCTKLGLQSKINDYARIPYITINVKNYKFNQFIEINSYTKYIPKEIFKQPKFLKWFFLSSLFEGDGYIDARRNKNYGISYSTVSKTLIHEIHHLLLTLNIYSVIKTTIAPIITKRLGKKAVVFTLHIEKNNIVKFLNNVFFICKNREKEILLTYFKNTIRNTNIDVIPTFGIFNNIYLGDQHNRTRTSAIKYINKQYRNLQTKKIRNEYKNFSKNMIVHQDFKKLKSLSTSDIFWDKITAVTKQKEEKMYDIQVRKNHNYIADDIFTHNSVFFTQIINIYDMSLFKYKRVIIISASQGQANRLLDEMKVIIENNEWLVSKINKNRWANETIGYNGGYVLVAGVGSEILGQHVDRIIVDDILRSDNKLSDIQIEDYVDMTLDPMLLNRDGQMILVGCVNENTMVLTKNGLIKIKDLKRTNDKLEPFNKDIYGIDGFNTATEIFDNGIKKTKKITFEFGYELECTYNHPLLVLNNDGKHIWKKAKDICKDDFVCISFNQNVFGNNDTLPKPNITHRRFYKKPIVNKITKELAYLIGLYTAEGSHYKQDSICITNTECGDFLLNNGLGLDFKTKDNMHYEYKGRYFIRQLINLGVSFKKSYEKTLPNLWNWKKELIIEFIRGYADGDGCADNRSIKFTSTSKKMLQELQILLLNFGILSSLTEFDPRGKYEHYIKSKHIRYDLNISSKFLSKFTKEIGFRIKRKQEKALKLKGKYLFYPNIKPLLKEALKKTSKKTSIKNCHHIYSKINGKFSTIKIFDYIKQFESQGINVDNIKNIIVDKYYVRPTTITESHSRTLDFIIPQTHSFVSNGMISHNTPKGASDIFATIFARKKRDPNCPWYIDRFPAILSYEKKLLQCPDRFTWQDIINKRLSMGSLKFAREYQLEFYSRDTSIFPPKIIEPSKKKGAERILINVAKKSRSPNLSYVIGVDTARSGSVSADYSVGIVIEYNNISQEKTVVHIWRKKGLKISEQTTQIAQLTKNFNNCMVLVEANNMGQEMIDELVDDYNVYVETFTTTANTKEELMRFLITSFEHGQIILPQGDEESRQTIGLLESELHKFCVTTTPKGNEKMEGVGSHDDCQRFGTLINTINGVKQIQNIKIGDYVLTHTGKYKKVCNTIKKPFSGKAYEIKPFGGNMITITYNHPILAATKNSRTYKMNTPKWILPTNIKKHRLMYKVNTTVKDSCEIDLLEYKPTRTNMFHRYTKHDNDFVWSQKNNKVARKIKVNNDFLRFIGLFLAEGSYNDKNNYISFGLHANETELQNFLLKYISETMKIKNVNCLIKKNSCTIHFSNVFWYNFFKNFGKRENKKLPAHLQFQFLAPKKQLHIFSGWFEGDGFTDSRGWNVGATISPHISSLMFDILLRNNINPNMRKLKRHRYEKQTKDQYWVEYKLDAGNNRKTKLENGYRYSAIQFVRQIELNEDVYNLEVEGDESYVAEQTIVHNCVISLALANKATQIGGSPFAITNFGGKKEAYNEYGSYTKTYNKGETDLVKLIKLGIIK